jgi:hypothetical protein
MYDASLRVSGQSFPEWPTFPQTSHVICESMVFTVLMGLQWHARQTSLGVDLFLWQAYLSPSRCAYLFVFWLGFCPPLALVSHHLFDQGRSPVGGER